MKHFEYFAPATMSEALMLLERYDGRAAVLAGGTDLLVSMKKKEKNPEYVINIKRIPELTYIEFNERDDLRIGSLATHEAIAEYIVNSPTLQDKFGLLASACNKVGTPQIRNMGTIGGNICQAGPSQDTPPVLLVLNAKLKLVSLRGERTIPIDEFFIAPFRTVLAEDELLTEICIPTPPPRSASCYQWRTKMSMVDETLAGVAILMILNPPDICKDIRIALCSVGPFPFRSKRAEQVLRGKKIEDKLVELVAKLAAEEISPRSRVDYRRKLCGILVKLAIYEVWYKIK